MTYKVSEVEVLGAKAEQLQKKYSNILELIQTSARKYSQIELIKNKIRIILRMKSLYQSQFLAPYHREIDAITTVDDAFHFLVSNNFIGYLNFQLLEYLSSEIICGEEGNDKVQEKLSEYKKCYAKFLEEPSFSDVIQVFDENPSPKSEYNYWSTNNSSYTNNGVEETKKERP